MSVATHMERLKAMTPKQRERLAQLAIPRVVDPYFVHIPHPKQQLFLSLQGREAMYGGAAGGGKSDALLMAAAQYVDVPGYSALILRRTWPDLNAPGAILDRARTWWGGLDVRIRDGGRIFEFPSGARIQFGYTLHDSDKYKFQSAEYQFIGFDELTQFDESIYTYMFSRVRRPQVACLNCRLPVRWESGNSWRHSNRKASASCPDIYPDPAVIEQYKPTQSGVSIFNVPLRVRSATNPGGRGHIWVRDRFINDKTKVPGALFIPASLSDNPSLDKETYTENLQHLVAVDKQRLLMGDWDVSEQGELFKRTMFSVVQSTAGIKGRRVRYWDRASTENGGDWTVGTLMCLSDDGKWYVEDVVRGQWSPLQCERIIASTASKDGQAVPIRMEQEPGSSGVDTIDGYRRRVLVGYNFDGIRSSGSKVERATGLVSAAEAGNVVLQAAQWNTAWLDEFDLFPVGANDDQVDAASGCLNFLTGQRMSRIIV